MKLAVDSSVLLTILKDESGAEAWADLLMHRYFKKLKVLLPAK